MKRHGGSIEVVFELLSVTYKQECKTQIERIKKMHDSLSRQQKEVSGA